MDEIIEKAQDFVLKKRGEDILFGYPHAEKVRMNSLYLSESLGGNAHLVQLASLLHDVAFDGKNLSAHAIESANEAKIFLRSVSYPEEEMNKVMMIIKKHDSRIWRDNFRPETLEEKIVSDAENLERLTPMGIIKHVVICKNIGYTSKETLTSTLAYYEHNKDKLFFDASKNKSEFDKVILEQFVKRVLEQSKL